MYVKLVIYCIVAKNIIDALEIIYLHLPGGCPYPGTEL